MLLKNHKEVELHFLKTNYALLQRAGEAPKLQFLMSKGELSPYRIIEGIQTLSISTSIPIVMQIAHMWTAISNFGAKNSCTISSIRRK